MSVCKSSRHRRRPGGHRRRRSRRYAARPLAWPCSRRRSAGHAAGDRARRTGEPGGAPPPARVLIHDAARPLVSAAVIDRVLGALERFPGRAAGRAGGRHAEAALGWQPWSASAIAAAWRRAQTPQGFQFAASWRRTVRRRRRLHRRHRDRRRGRAGGRLGRGRGAQPQAHPAGGSAGCGTAARRRHALADRAGLRRPCLRARSAAGPVRCDRAPRTRPCRPFRRRRRLPRDHRRHPGHDRRWRYRQPLPAQRPALAERRFLAVPAARRRTCWRSGAAGSRTSTW